MVLLQHVLASLKASFTQQTLILTPLSPTINCDIVATCVHALLSKVLLVTFSYYLLDIELIVVFVCQYQIGRTDVAHEDRLYLILAQKVLVSLFSHLVELRGCFASPTRLVLTFRRI